MSAGADLLSEITDLWNEIQGKYQSLQDKVNSMLSKVPGWLDWIVDKVRDGWNWLVEKFNEAVDAVTYIFGNMGKPWELSSTANEWSSRVGGPVSGQVTNVDAGLLLADDNWTGDAADQYKQHIPLQKAALQAIKTTFTDAIGQALDKVQTAIIVFWGALIVGLGAFVGGMIGALTSAATIFGLPAAPFIAAAAALAFVGAFYAGGLNLKSQSSGANTALVAKLNENTAFPDGAWPPGTAA